MTRTRGIRGPLSGDQPLIVSHFVASCSAPLNVEQSRGRGFTPCKALDECNYDYLLLIGSARCENCRVRAPCVWLCFCSQIFLNCSPIFVIELSWGKERSTNSREVSNNRVMMQQVAKNLFISRNGTIKTCKCQRMSCKGQKGSWKCVSKPWNDSQKPGAANVWCCVQASVGMTSHCAHCPHTSAIVARRSPRVTQYQV